MQMHAQRSTYVFMPPSAIPLARKAIAVPRAAHGYKAEAHCEAAAGPSTSRARMAACYAARAPMQLRPISIAG